MAEPATLLETSLSPVNEFLEDLASVDRPSPRRSSAPDIMNGELLAEQTRRVQEQAEDLERKRRSSILEPDPSKLAEKWKSVREKLRRHLSVRKKFLVDSQIKKEDTTMKEFAMKGSRLNKSRSKFGSSKKGSSMYDVALHLTAQAKKAAPWVEKYDQFAKRAREYVTDSDGFQTVITFCILLAGINVGVQTYPISESASNVTETIDRVILFIFVFEAVLKLVCEGAHPFRYFKDPWNVFDFLIVCASFLPIEGNQVAMLRLIRILRVFKLIRALPELRMLVMSLFASFGAIGYILVMMVLQFYLWAVIGVLFFGKNDPVNFGTLQEAFLALWRSATGDDWTDMAYIALMGCDQDFGGQDYAGSHEKLCTDASKANYAMVAIYFISFQVIANLIIINMFVGAVMLSVAEAKADVAMGEILKVKIVRCENLEIADPGFGMGLGSSDPYVVLQVGTKKFKTKTLKRQLNPVFEQEFEFWPLEQFNSDILKLVVLDWDRFGGDDPLGDISINFKNLPYDHLYLFECDLDNCEHGKIFVEMSKIINDPTRIMNAGEDDDRSRWAVIGAKVQRLIDFLPRVVSGLRQRKNRKAKEKKEYDLAHGFFNRLFSAKPPAAAKYAVGSKIVPIDGVEEIILPAVRFRRKSLTMQPADLAQMAQRQAELEEKTKEEEETRSEQQFAALGFSPSESSRHIVAPKTLPPVKKPFRRTASDLSLLGAGRKSNRKERNRVGAPKMEMAAHEDLMLIKARARAKNIAVPLLDETSPNFGVLPPQSGGSPPNFGVLPLQSGGPSFRVGGGHSDGRIRLPSMLQDDNSSSDEQDGAVSPRIPHPDNEGSRSDNASPVVVVDVEEGDQIVVQNFQPSASVDGDEESDLVVSEFLSSESDGTPVSVKPLPPPSDIVSPSSGRGRARLFRNGRVDSRINPPRQTQHPPSIQVTDATTVVEDSGVVFSPSFGSRDVRRPTLDGSGFHKDNRVKTNPVSSRKFMSRQPSGSSMANLPTASLGVGTPSRQKKKKRKKHHKGSSFRSTGSSRNVLVPSPVLSAARK